MQLMFKVKSKSKNTSSCIERSLSPSIPYIREYTTVRTVHTSKNNERIEIHSPSANKRSLRPASVCCNLPVATHSQCRFNTTSSSHNLPCFKGSKWDLGALFFLILPDFYPILSPYQMYWTGNALFRLDSIYYIIWLDVPMNTAES